MTDAEVCELLAILTPEEALAERRARWMLMVAELACPFLVEQLEKCGCLACVIAVVADLQRAANCVWRDHSVVA